MGFDGTITRMDYAQNTRVPMSSPDITEAERQAVAQVLQGTALSMGPYIQQFEQIFRDFCGRPHALGVSSGTAGLHMCVRAAGITEGDWVITTPFSFVASTNVLLYERATPVFVDVDPLSGNIDANLVSQAADDLMQGGKAAEKWLPRKAGFSTNPQNGKLKGVLAVDVFGQPADYDPLRQTTSRYGLTLIEDSCEALGAEYKQQKAGTLGDMGVFAFYPNKQMTTAEGGMVITNNTDQANIMTALRNQGRAVGDTWLEHSYLGYNYRLDELSAALGAVQMQRLPELMAKRQKVADWYLEALQNINGVEPPAIAPTTTLSSWFVYVIRFDPHLSRDLLAQQLKARGIPCRPYFSPIHLQPYMRDLFGYQPGDFPITEDLGQRGLALPFSGVMTREQVQLVCHELASLVAAA